MRIPAVLRCPLYGGLEIACARAWCLFLAREAEWNDDDQKATYYQQRADGLSHGLRGSLWDKTLEAAITSFQRRFRDD